MIVTAAQLAELYGVDRRTVTNWLNEDPPCPSRKRKKDRVFETVDVARWHQERAARHAIAQHERTKPADFEDARARKMAAEALLAEIQVEEKRGQLVPVEVVGETVAELAERIRAVLVNAPSNYLLTLERAGVSAAAGEEVLERLSQDLTRALRGAADEVADDGDDDDTSSSG